MIAKKTTLLWAVLGATLLAARANAQPQTEPEGEAKPAAGDTGTDGAAQLTLPKGRLVLDVFVPIGLSTGAAFKPISISPDVWYGATPDLTVGLVHSSVGASGFIGGVGTSLCLSGTANGCPDVYRGFGLDARYKLKTGMFAWAADGGLFFSHLSDPLLLSLKLGAVGRWESGKLAVELQPNLFIGVTNRSQTVAMVDVTTNPDILSIPVTVLYAVTPMISVSGQVGVSLPLENAGDNYAIPLSIGGHYHVNESLNVTLAFSLLRLAAGADPKGFDARSLTLGGTYAF
ncbi:MAG TPA: hypothetical protein VGD37_34340 [Kofleriaceae bacterium]|jgi:hypothetical protein